MKMKSAKRAIRFCLLLGALSLVVSCGSEKCTEVSTGESPPTRQTPEGLLQVLSQSYRQRDIEAYADCLDEYYMFIFAEQDWDVAAVSPDNPYWGKTEDVYETAKMFIDTCITSIEFDLEIMSKDITDSLVYMRTEPYIRVTLVKEGTEPEIWLVNETLLDFSCKLDRHNPGLWTVLEIEEIIKNLYSPHAASAGLDIEAESFGRLKARYRAISSR